MSTLRPARLKISRNIEADVEGAVKLYRSNGAKLMQAEVGGKQDARTLETIHDRTHTQREIELALVMAGLNDLVVKMREEREVVEKIYRRKRAGMDYSTHLKRRAALKRIIDGRAAEADIELAR